MWGCELKYLSAFQTNSFHWSASLWGCELKCYIYFDTWKGKQCQPPCEAVSWNAFVATVNCGKTVSLLVRLWVEIICMAVRNISVVSASLWGCELKYSTVLYRYTGWSQPPCEAVSWNFNTGGCDENRNVSLLVRLWVEIYGVSKILKNKQGQPPCEAVSWNVLGNKTAGRINRQPPCEAVSWNNSVAVSEITVCKSASLWGCELKFQCPHNQPYTVDVSLLVRLWVEIRTSILSANCLSVSLLVRLWVEI